MPRTTWPLLALVAALNQAGLAWSQAPTPGSLPATSAPAPYVLPPVNRTPSVPAIVDPILDDSPAPAPGFFVNADLYVFRPHLAGRLVGSPDQGATVLDLALPGSLGTVASPRFEFGYRLPEQLGEFRVGYWFETAERTNVPGDSLGGLGERDRLNVNVVDLDWLGRNPLSLPQGWDLRFNVGVRIGAVYFDTTRDFGAAGNAAGMVGQRGTSSYIGAGPEAGVEVSREVGVPGLAVTVRLSGALLFGEIEQSFLQTTVGGAAGDRFSNQVTAPMLDVQVGVSYTPPAWNYSRVFAGYVWDEWWHIGRLNTSDANLLNRGAVFRLEWNF
jgi:hypothetical protein